MANLYENDIPIFLLKTKSTPSDGYEEYFSKFRIKNRKCEPIFTPVLEHRFNVPHLQEVKQLLATGQIEKTGKYCGIIFTSQRAVEAFREVVYELIENTPTYSLPQDLPFYVVGPATFKTLAATPTLKKDAIYGEASGNGETLAHYVLDHYSQTTRRNVPLLFLVGEQRRDIIPKTLMDSNLPDEQRIEVKELTVYETGVMETFEENFKICLSQHSEAMYQWVVVFSPAGCEATLRGLDFLDFPGGKANPRKRNRNIFLATIGPTTRDILMKDFGIEPDVCAETPNAEGIGQGISRFMELNIP